MWITIVATVIAFSNALIRSSRLGASLDPIILQLYERTATLHMKFKQLSTTKVSAIFQEPDDTKRDGMIDMLTEDEAKMLCKFLFEILPRRGEQKVRIKTVS